MMDYDPTQRDNRGYVRRTHFGNGDMLEWHELQADIARAEELRDRVNPDVIYLANCFTKGLRNESK